MHNARDAVYRDRPRSQSFGSVAEQYDRYRPSYPDGLFTELQSSAARRVLDIGCGTGKAGRELAARGLSVLGVEVDPDMAAVARARGLDVEVAAFEDWDTLNRKFDLAICAQAWHWIDPVAGPRKVASLLTPGGVLACFWNHDRAHRLHGSLTDIYRRLAPDCEAAAVAGESGDEPHVDSLRGSGVFAEVVVRRYEWSETMTAAEWVGRIATYSDHIRLPAGKRTALLDEVYELVASEEEPVKLPVGTYAIFARVP